MVRPNLLLSLTQASLDKYVGTLQEHAIVVVDSGITVPEEVQAHHQVISLPILNSAVEVIKNPMAANIISVGAVNEIMQIASEASLEEAVLNHIPKGIGRKEHQGAASGRTVGKRSPGGAGFLKHGNK